MSFIKAPQIQDSDRESVLSQLSTNYSENDFLTSSDNFQLTGYKTINENNNLLVIAPTGSGKTRFINYSCMYYLEQGKKIVITTPIKALSNQKFQEMTEMFSNYEVGLITGDIKINPNADIIIMTTEILMESIINYNDTNNKETRLNDSIIPEIGVVVFDEAHYFNNQGRGGVWEYIYINLPAEIKVVLLSATFNNPEVFSSWLATVRTSDVILIEKTIRPVPLNHHIFYNGDLYEIKSKDNYRPNVVNTAINDYNRTKKRCNVNYMIEYLKENELMQAIFFVFSKNQCQKFAKMVSHHLLDHEEQSEVIRTFNFYMQPYKHLYENTKQYRSVESLIEKGVCYHHAGMIPIIREVVELLYSRNLVKVLFATETFSVGLNMPTKTVIFTSLKKPMSNGLRLLLPSEYIQMSGRAGRRGMDDTGTVIFYPMYGMYTREEFNTVINTKRESMTSKMLFDESFIIKMKNTTIDINELYQKSYASVNNTRLVSEMKTELDEMKTDFEPNKKDSEMLVYYNQYKDLLQFDNMFVQLTKKDQKNFDMLQRYMKHREEFSQYARFLDRKRELEHNIVGLESLNISYHIRQLENKGFIENDELTMKGRIGSFVNESSPVLIGEIFEREVLLGLNEVQLTTVMSILIQGRSEMTLGEVEIDDDEIKDTVRVIEGIIDELNIDVRITYEFMQPVYEWMSGSSFMEVVNDPVNEGLFIKNMLKLNNVVRELIAISKTFEFITLLPVLTEINSVLVRDQVCVNSLYVNI